MAPGVGVNRTTRATRSWGAGRNVGVGIGTNGADKTSNGKRRFLFLNSGHNVGFRVEKTIDRITGKISIFQALVRV